MEDRLYGFLEYYYASPHWVKEISGRIYNLVPISIRYGRIYTEYVELLEQSQWWSRQEIEQYQWRQLESLLKHAYQNVPFYRRIFDERGLTPEQIQNFDDFRQLPFLTKELVRNNFDDLVAKNYSKSKQLSVMTGGSTGNPLLLYYEKGVSRPKELAFITALWYRMGYEFGDKVVVLEHFLGPSAGKKGLWAYDPIKNRLLFSIYHMTDHNLPKYIQKIREFTPKFIHALPSALMILTRFMKLNNISHFPSVRAIFCSSENLNPEQRNLFEEIFKCRVFDWYGQVELVSLAGGCEKSNCYHVFPEYGITEIIGKDGTIVTNDGEVGEVVGTGFNNWLMPLIRYRMEDLAVHSNSECMCGRAYPILSGIEGRIQQFFVAKDDSLIPLLGNYDIAVKMLSKIKAIQLVQEEKGLIKVNVVKEARYGENEVRKQLVSKLKQGSGNLPDSLLHFEISFVHETPRTKRGKQGLLVQKLPVDFGYEPCK